MRLSTTFVLVLLLSALYAQDLKLTCGIRVIPCNNGNKTHFHSIMDCSYFETDTSHIPKFILDSGRNYLIDRVGENFYKKLTFYECQIVNFKKYDRSMGIGIEPWKGHGGNKKIKYAIQY